MRWQAQRNTAFAPPHLKRRCGFALPAVSKEKEAGQNARPLVCELFLVNLPNYFFARPYVAGASGVRVYGLSASTSCHGHRIIWHPNGQKESEWTTFDRPVGIVVFRHQTGQAGIIREEQAHSSRLRLTGLEQNGCFFCLTKRMENPQP